MKTIWFLQPSSRFTGRNNSHMVKYWYFFSLGGILKINRTDSISISSLVFLEGLWCANHLSNYIPQNKKVYTLSYF